MIQYLEGKTNQHSNCRSSTFLHLNLYQEGAVDNFHVFTEFIIDRKAREIMYLVASVRLSVNGSHYQSEVFVCVSVISHTHNV